MQITKTKLQDFLTASPLSPSHGLITEVMEYMQGYQGCELSAEQVPDVDFFHYCHLYQQILQISFFDLTPNDRSLRRDIHRLLNQDERFTQFFPSKGTFWSQVDKGEPLSDPSPPKLTR